MTGTTGEHASRGFIAAYVAGDETLPAQAVWALESHLDSCEQCGRQVAEAVPSLAPRIDALLSRVWVDVDAATVQHPAPVRSPVLRWARTWAPPSMAPWLLMVALVALAALGLDVSAPNGRFPSLVLLVSPIIPLICVAAAWARKLDPMFELTASTPRAGLRLILRRTAAVLVVVIPLLAVISVFADVSPALSLLPCLAFTLGTLALGTVIGVGRAAAGLGAAWAVFVIAPSLATAEISVLLQPSSLLGWGVAAALAAIVVATRAHAFDGLPSQN
jgi:hypothetical protein